MIVVLQYHIAFSKRTCRYPAFVSNANGIDEQIRVDFHYLVVTGGRFLGLNRLRRQRKQADETHTIRRTNRAATRTNTAFPVTGLVFDLATGSGMQPFGLSKEPAEKQDGQNHNDGDEDDLD